MAILLTILLLAAAAVVGDAIVENTSTTTITIAGQELSGLTLGGWLAAFAILGFLSAYFLLGMLAAGRRARMRRRAVRSSEREMAERVAELERENSTLRDQTVDDHTPSHREPAVRDDTLVDQPGRRSGDGPGTNVFGRVSGRRAAAEGAPAKREQSSIDDYPPSPTGDGRRDRWPEPAEEQAARERTAENQGRLTRRP